MDYFNRTRVKDIIYNNAGRDYGDITVLGWVRTKRNPVRLPLLS